jgi:hypothetical protein
VFLGAVYFSDPLSFAAGEKAEKCALMSALEKRFGFSMTGDTCSIAKLATN